MSAGTRMPSGRTQTATRPSPYPNLARSPATNSHNHEPNITIVSKNFPARSAYDTLAVLRSVVGSLLGASLGVRWDNSLVDSLSLIGSVPRRTAYLRL